MDPRKLIEIMAVAERLKNATRHSWTSSGRHESVAEHCWRLALLALLVGDEFPEADHARIIRMCLIHDLGEAFTGDIPSFEKSEADERRESEALDAWVATLPRPWRTEFEGLYAEMETQQTLESRIYKALDKLEAVIQHNEADLSTWLPLEHTLNFTYGREEASFSEYLTRLHAQTDLDAARKLREAGIEPSVEVFPAGTGTDENPPEKNGA